jgi:hypothetical protein
MLEIGKKPKEEVLDEDTVQCPSFTLLPVAAGPETEKV